MISSSLKKGDCNVISHEPKDWRIPIKSYILENIELEDPLEKRRIRNKVAHFTIVGEELYRKGLLEGSMITRRNYSLLRVGVSNQEGNMITRSIHQGRGGVHQGSKNLARQFERQGYYWPNLFQDAKEVATKCDECQRHRNIQRAPSIELTTISTPLRFVRWSLDIVGTLTLSKKKRKYIFVMMDFHQMDRS